MSDDLPRIRELANKPLGMNHARVFRMGKCTMFVAYESPAGGWHLSISKEGATPTWAEIKKARYELLPDDITMALILPPTDEYVNLGEVWHLHEIPGEVHPPSWERKGK